MWRHGGAAAAAVSVPPFRCGGGRAQDYVAAQVKTVYFLSYLLRQFSEIMRPHQVSQRISKPEPAPHSRGGGRRIETAGGGRCLRHCRHGARQAGRQMQTDRHSALGAAAARW